MFPFAATAMPFGVLRAALTAGLLVTVECGRARPGERDDVARVVIDPADPVAPGVGDVKIAVRSDGHRRWRIDAPIGEQDLADRRNR